METVVETEQQKKDREELERLKQIKADREELKKLQAEMDWRKKNFAIKYYVVKPDGTFLGPHEKQSSFHKSKALIRVASGGNRSGKSSCGINESVSHAIGYRPWLKKDDPNYMVDVLIPNKGLVCGESFGEQVKKVLVPKLLGDYEKNVPGAIPKDMLASVKRNPQGVITEIHLTNRSSIYLQSYDQPVELFESSDHDWAHFDEPPPRPIWVAAQRGLTDRRGRSWITMTPLKEPWIYDEIYSRKDVDLFYFDIEDNLNYGLSREGIDQFASSLTPDEKEARLRGRYFHLTGLVYKSYGPTHRIPRFTIPEHWAIYMHIDTHPRTPHHAVYIAVAPDQKKFICGELKNGDSANRIKPFVEALKVYEKTTFKRSLSQFVRLIEPASQVPDPMRDGRSIWDEFNDAGLHCAIGSKNRDAGILLLQDGFQHDPLKGVYPTVYVFNDLPGVHYELTHYIWDDWAQKAAQGKTDKQVPKDKDDHFVEGIHRILLSEPYCETHGTDEDSDRVETHSTGNRITGY